MAFFDRFFPVLGTKFGLGPLGIFQCLYVFVPLVFFQNLNQISGSQLKSSLITSMTSLSFLPSSFSLLAA
jgi:hypothetical protein